MDIIKVFYDLETTGVDVPFHTPEKRMVCQALILSTIVHNVNNPLCTIQISVNQYVRPIIHNVNNNFYRRLK